MLRLAAALFAVSITAAHASVLTHVERLAWSGQIPSYEPGHEFDFTAWAPPPTNDVLAITFYWAGHASPDGGHTRLYVGPTAKDGNSLTLTDIDFNAFLATPYVGLGVSYNPTGIETYISPQVDGAMTMTVAYDPVENVPEPVSLALLALGLTALVALRLNPSAK